MNNRRSRLLLWIPGLLVVGLIGLVIYQGIQQNKATAKREGINVVASLNSYGDIAQAVLGSAGKVTNVIAKPEVDPHDFEPTPNTAKLYESADVIISNGGGLDAWSDKLVKANPKAKTITVADAYNYKEGDNEHFWYEPDVTEKLTAELVQIYSELIPNDRHKFEANAQAYMGKFKKVTDLRDKLTKKLDDKAILTTEPVFDPWLKAMGVKVLVPEFARAVEEGQDPTPAAMKAWEDAARRHKAIAVIQNTQAASRLTDQAVDTAKRVGLPIVQVSETKPANVNYIDWQYKQLKALEKAVK